MCFQKKGLHFIKNKLSYYLCLWSCFIFHYWYSISFWNQIGTLHLKWILMFMIPIFVKVLPVPISYKHQHSTAFFYQITCCNLDVINCLCHISNLQCFQQRDFRPVYARLVVDKVALRQIFLWVLLFSPVLHAHLIHLSSVLYNLRNGWLH